MMTTNKNQRSTHIDDVVKYQPMPFFAAHCAICDFFYNYLCMHFIFADENDEITHTYALVIARTQFHSLSQSKCFGFCCVLVFCHLCPSFTDQYTDTHTRIYSYTFFFSLVFHTLFHPIVPFVQNYVSRQKKIKYYSKWKTARSERITCERINETVRRCMKQYGRYSLTTHKIVWSAYGVLRQHGQNDMHSNEITCS